MMKHRITDEQLDQLILDSMENPPNTLRHKVEQIPQDYGYQMSWNAADRVDSMIVVVTGMLGLWITGLVLLYHTAIISFMSNLFPYTFLGSATYWSTPFLGFMTIIIVFSRYLFPCNQFCED